MLPPDGRFVFGRVIRTNVLPPMAATLIYVYSYRTDAKEPPGELSREALLIPPTLTNALGWFHGVFETIDQRPLTERDVLRQHCFYAAGRYYDEYSNPLQGPHEPCGVGGVTSYRMLDDRISDALGIERVPELE